MSTSSAEGLGLLQRWRRQRFSLALWLPVAVTLTLASTLPLDLGDSWALALWRCVAAWCALGGLRLWDDLEDLPHDRAHHPGRALVAASSLEGAWAGAGGALIVAAAALHTGGGRLGVFAGVVLGLAVFYRLRWHTRSAGPWLRLIKYPALVAALGGGLAPGGALAMALVYACVCHDELLQEADGSRGVRVAVAAASGLLAVGWAVSWWGERSLFVGSSVAAALMNAVLIGSFVREGKGAPIKAVRSCLLLLTMLLFALPQIARFL